MTLLVINFILPINMLADVEDHWSTDQLQILKMKKSKAS